MHDHAGDPFLLTNIGILCKACPTVLHVQKPAVVGRTINAHSSVPGILLHSCNTAYNYLRVGRMPVVLRFVVFTSPPTARIDPGVLL